MLHQRLSPLLLLSVTLGCSASGGTGKTFTTGTGETTSTSAAGTGGAGGATGSSSGDTGVGGAFTGSGGNASGTGTGGAPEIAEVYGNSPDVLYRLDPTNNAVTTIGPFQGCSSVIDIALDKDSNLYATTFGSLLSIDKATAACTQIAQGAFPNSLSFVPAGTVDPNKETLVGYLGSQYVAIDTVSGQVTTIGGLSGGYASSGDIVSVKGGKTYLTATGPDCIGGDCLLEIDPKTGDLVKNWGPLPGYGAVFGLAFWAGKAYGFSDAGQLFEIDFAMSGISVVPISIPGNPQLEFWGAGSTTSAPVEPVPK